MTTWSIPECRLAQLKRPSVERDGLGGRSRDPFAQRLRSEHLGQRSVCEQIVEGVVEPLELRDHRRPLAVLNNAGCAGIAHLAARDTHRDLELPVAALERLRATGPGGSEVEAGGRVDGSVRSFAETTRDTR
jgi:hypothetical protein